MNYDPYEQIPIQEQPYKKHNSTIIILSIIIGILTLAIIIMSIVYFSYPYSSLNEDQCEQKLAEMVSIVYVAEDLLTGDKTYCQVLKDFYHDFI